MGSVFFRGACFQSKEQDIDALCTTARTHFNLKSRQFSLYAWEEKDNDERLDVRVDTNEALEALSIDGVTKLRVSLDGFMQLPQSPPPLFTKQPRKDYVAVRVWKADGTFEAAFHSLFDMRYFIDEECDDEKLAYTLNEIFHDDEHSKDVGFSADVWRKNTEVRRFLLLLLEDVKYFDLEDFIEEEYDENDVHGIGMQRLFTLSLIHI